MARKFMIEYESESFNSYFGREEFFIVVQYASQLNDSLAKDLYFAGETEYIYRSENGISLEGLEYNSSHQTHFDIDKLTRVINFIDNELIPSLELESLDDIILILGGWEDLKTKIDQGKDYKKRFGLISSEEKICTRIYNYTFFLNSLKNVIKNSLQINKPYHINYSE